MSDRIGAYPKLQEKFRRIAALSDAISILGWDREAIMPIGGKTVRSEQIATLAVLRHAAMTSPDLEDLMGAASEEPLNSWQAANLREIKKKHLHASAVSSSLVDSHSRASAECQSIWRIARPSNDFPSIIKPLQKVLALTREIAASKADQLKKTPYDSLLDQYEPDGSSEQIDQIFSRLEKVLKGILPEIIDKQKNKRGKRIIKKISTKHQRELNFRVLKEIGFDFERGRLDESAHPFSGGVPGDVRITTRYDENDWTSSLMATIHEAGHGMYEQGLPSDWRGQPVGSSRGMVIHESQSLLLEMQVCRSQEFFSFVCPIITDVFGIARNGWSPDSLYENAISVSSSLIRVEADEVTYPLHIILRYRLERAMLDGDLKIRDLPEAWNEGLEENLGIRSSTDREGCLQDVHWYDGSFGYFPTYTLGALAAAQLFKELSTQHVDILEMVSRGNFSDLFLWLRDKIHSWGSYYDTHTLLLRATGKQLSEDAFLQHIKNRYLSRK